MSEVPTRTQGIRALVVGQTDVESYRASMLSEVRTRFAERDAALHEAELGVDAAVNAQEPEQARLWRSQVTRRRRRRDLASTLLRVVEAGYLPIPRLPSVRLSSLKYRSKDNLIPPEALDALAEAKEIPGWQAFELVDGKDWAGRSLRRGSRDPILVGIVDGEMFPLAWWR